jgi:hypothetical protein
VKRFFFLTALAVFLALGVRPLQAAPSKEYWLRNYSLSPYGQYWTLTLSVKDLDADLPKILDAISKSSGTLTEPLSSFASSRSPKVQQLSYRIPKKAAQSSLQKLGAVGVASDPVKRPNDDLAYLSDIKAQIGKLSREKKRHPKALAAMPNVSDLVDQLLTQLETIEGIYEKADDDVLVNLTVQQSR